MKTIHALALIVLLLSACSRDNSDFDGFSFISNSYVNYVANEGKEPGDINELIKWIEVKERPGENRMASIRVTAKSITYYLPNERVINKNGIIIQDSVGKRALFEDGHIKSIK